MVKLDTWLDSMTMYRATIYYLAALLSLAVLLAATGRVGYSAQSLVLQVSLLVLACLVANYVMAWWVGAPAQWEPALITALILSLIIGPIQDGQRMIVLWAAGFAIASKYVLRSQMRQWFNPAAIGVVLLGLGGYSASWWVGTGVLLPWVLIGGVLLLRKLRRGRLVGLFVLVGVGGAALVGVVGGDSLAIVWRHVVLTSPLWFLGFVMLTEPTTSPPTRGWQMVYAMVVAGLSWPFVRWNNFNFSPELALVMGNAMTVAFVWRPRAWLQLQSKVELAPGIWDFTFLANRSMQFRPGQYLDWVIDHKADSRGKRRMFSVASSPTERLIHVGVKVVPDGSSFKRTLLSLRPGQRVVAGSASGDFQLPKKPQKMAWVAGGIGITPYRSMAKYMLDTNGGVETVLLYGVPTAGQLVYGEVFGQALSRGWLRPLAFVADGTVASQPWQTMIGRIDAEQIVAHVPDWRERQWYISGPQVMVESVGQSLRDLGVPRRMIKTDYFVGFS